MSALAERPSALELTESRDSATARPWRTIALESDIAAIEADWLVLQKTALVTPYQAHGWIEAFSETVGAAHGLDIRHAVLRDGQGRPLAILPLTITQRRGIRFAEFVGGKHANYHMGLYEPGFAAALGADAARAMLAEIAALLGGLDVFVFVNQPTSWQGHPNPLAALASGPSPSHAYKLALDAGDCEGTLRRAMSSHAHKKLKNKRNRFAAFGPSQVVKAQGEAEIARVIDAFLVQKAARFKAMGVADPFADPAMRAFLQRGATAQGEALPALELYSLDINGRSVATYVGAVQGARFSGMATSFDMAGEIARASPGEILLVELVKRQCHAGIAVFDLGVGEARYKTTICDDRDELVDSFVPMTPKGRAFAALVRARRAAKRRIKSSPLLLKLAQRVSGWFNRGRHGAED